MTQRINQLPRGLLNYLQSQSGGHTPQDLLDEVRSTLEMDRFYRAARDEIYLASSEVVNGEGFFREVAGTTLSVVPNDEIWIVSNYTLRQKGAALAAGEIYQVAPAFRNVGAGLTQDDWLLGPVTPAFTIGKIAYAESRVPYVALPGDIHGLVCMEHAVIAAGTFAMNLRFTRLKI